jgi:hypothetical protein
MNKGEEFVRYWLNINDKEPLIRFEVDALTASRMIDKVLEYERKNMSIPKVTHPDIHFSK